MTDAAGKCEEDTVEDVRSGITEGDQDNCMKSNLVLCPSLIMSFCRTKRTGSRMAALDFNTL